MDYLLCMYVCMAQYLPTGCGGGNQEFLTESESESESPT